MAGIVDTIAGEKVQDSSTVGSVEVGSETSRVADVHLQEVEQADPLRINVILVQNFQRGRNRGLCHARLLSVGFLGLRSRISPNGVI